MSVTLAANHQGHIEQGVRQVGLVATQVELDAAGARHRTGHPVRQHVGGRQHPDSPPEVVVAHRGGHGGGDRAYAVQGCRQTGGPACRHVLLEPADPVVHVVHPPAGRLLHHFLQRLAFPEALHHSRIQAGAQKHQMAEDPVDLGEQGAQPHRPVRQRHAKHPLDRQDDAELVAEGRQPVVAVGEHDQLAIVPDLEEFLGAAVHKTDLGLGADHDVAVEHQVQLQYPV